MEKNPDSKQPEFCVNNCGFYGNPIYNNMCSKCFKEHQQKQNKLATQASTTLTTTQQQQVSDVMKKAGLTEPNVLSPQSSQEASTGTNASSDVAPAVAASTLIHNPLASESVPITRVHTPLSSGISPSASGSSTPTKRTQANKGRCFKCRSRVPLVKQTTNKCRCEHIFCDAHRFPDQHNCEFDFVARDRKDLEKRNPKINDHPKGGRSFTRID